MNNEKFFLNKKTNRLNKYNFIALILAVFISISVFLFIFLHPDIFNYKNSHSSNLQIIIENLVSNGRTIGKKTAIVIFILLLIFELLCIAISLYLIFRVSITYLTYKKWYPHLLNEQAKIINSCVDSKRWKDKVVMLIPVCNDFLPNTILQTAKQTYQNIDIWIIDDSSKPEIQQEIKAFCKSHNFHLLQRDPNHKKAHPTKIGNIYYFLSKYGHQYDYIFENDSSSIVTPNFVYNALCYFKSPLINNAKIACVIANGSFYGARNVLSYLYSKFSQYNETFGTGSGMFNSTNSTLVNGWCAMYKVSSLAQIPLEEIECTVCDAARGFWWTKNNMIVYTDCYSFSAKLSPQTIIGIKNQKLKWHTGDIFLQRNVAPGKFAEKNAALAFKSMYLFITVIMPVQYFLFIFKSIIWIILLNDSNLEPLVIKINSLTILFWFVCAIFYILIFLSFIIYYKLPIKILFQFFLFALFIETALWHHRIFHIVIYSLFKKRKVKKNSFAFKFVTKNLQI